MQYKPNGLCGCGCGETPPLAPTTRREIGWVRGEPIYYVPGHQARKSTPLYAVNPETGCWEWQRNVSPDGYGLWKRDGVARSAHIYFWVDRNGEVPDGLQLDHLCRVRHCVNPEHLEPVTAAENVQRGKNAKLTKEDVLAIRASTESGLTLAKRYRVENCTISRIRLRKSWRNI